MRPNDSRTARDTVRPESQPHGTTESQINEMESEGQGGASKERSRHPLRRRSDRVSLARPVARSPAAEAPLRRHADRAPRQI
jgi:hypothetical protein